MESKELLMEERSKFLKEHFEDFFIIYNGKPLKFNAVGFILDKNSEYVVVRDMPELGITGHYYKIYEIKEDHIGDDSLFAVFSVESEETYNRICDLWEERVKAK